MGESESARQREIPSVPVGLPSTSSGRRRRSRRRSSSRKTRARLRKLYFSLAAIWGFLIGTVTIVGGLAALGRPLHFGPVVGIALLIAAVLSVLGGFVAAAAYREASGRFR